MNGGEKVLYNISHMGESLACHKCTFIKGFVIRNKVVRWANPKRLQWTKLKGCAALSNKSTLWYTGRLHSPKKIFKSRFHYFPNLRWGQEFDKFDHEDAYN